MNTPERAGRPGDSQPLPRGNDLPVAHDPGINACRVVTVVEVVSLVGSGDLADPVREVVEYYAFDGELLARRLRGESLPLGVWSDGRLSWDTPP